TTTAPPESQPLSLSDTVMAIRRGAVIKILDMGLARLKQPLDSQESTLTQEGMVMGTPDFMSPEQALDSRNVDIRADIFSLGGTLYYLLTGQVPFLGSTIMEKIYRLSYEEPEPVEKLCPGLPAEVAAIVRKMMAKKPPERFQLPMEVADALAPFARP